ncbi:MAG: hypothetical protein QXD23_04025, partial [Candidatus Micrarchaeaceae archaeon]
NLFNQNILIINGINGALSDSNAAHVFLNRSLFGQLNNSVGASSVYGNYLLLLNVYSNKLSINENLVLPGEISLLEKIQNAPILTNNQSTSLDNLSRSPPTQTNVNLINISTLNKNLGGNWRFLKGQNITSGLPQGGLKYIVENFTNGYENFTLSLGNFTNTTSAVGIYNNGLQTLSKENNFKIKNNAFLGGLSYTQVSGSITNLKNQPEVLLSEINPYYRYLVQTSVYSTNLTINLDLYKTELNNIQEQIMSEFGSMPIPGNSTYIKANQISALFGGIWNVKNNTYTNKTNYGNIKYVIKNYTDKNNDLIKQETQIFNTQENVSLNYEDIISNLISNNSNINTITGALNNGYSYTITNNTNITNNKNLVEIIAPYGNKIIQIELYPNSTKPITISNSGLLLLTLLNYTEK